MANDNFKVSNAPGMWIRTAPVVSTETEKKLVPNGQIMTKLGDSTNPDWWHVRTTFQGVEIEGFSKKSLMVPDGQPDVSTEPGTISEFVAKTLSVLNHLAPDAHPNYLQAIREGGARFESHGITTPQRMAHFLAQAMQETGSFTVLRESMRYSVPRMLEIFGVGNHSARVTAAEAPGLAFNEHALAERVYGLGNPHKAEELGNTEPGDGFRFRGNGILQMTGREAHRKRGQANGLDFIGNPDLATLPEHALKPALQEWADGNLNVAADQNKIVKITRVINGGENGLPERRAFFNKLLPRLSS
jgi:predicted chitinase